MLTTSNSSFYYLLDGGNLVYYLNNLVANCYIALYGFASVANALIILVFLKEGLKTTPNISFFTLAVADMMISIIWTAHDVAMDAFQLLPLDVFERYIWIYLFPCVEAINTIGSWITVVITWERTFCIAYPLTVKRIFTRKMIASLYLGALAYEVVVMTIFFTAEWLKEETYKEGLLILYLDNGRFRTNVTGGEKAKFDSKMQNAALFHYMRNMALMARSIIPNYILYALILLGSVILVFIFRRSIQMKKSLTGGGSKNDKKQEMSVKEKRVVKSVIAICVIYLLTVTPLTVYITYTYFFKNKTSRFLKTDFLELIRGFNHACNIFVYLAVNTNFRRQFKNLFCFCFTGKSLNSN